VSGNGSPRSGSSQSATPSRYWTAGIFILTAVFFGTQFVGIRAAVGAIPPIFYAGLRFDIGAIVALSYVGLTRGNWGPRTRGDYNGILAFGLFVVTLENTLLFVGQQFTTAAAASVMFSFTPIFAPLFALWLLPDERFIWIGAIGLALGLVGAIVVIQPNPMNLLSTSVVGQLLIMLAAILTALGTVLVKRASPTMGSTPVAAWGMVLGAVLIHLTSIALGESITAIQVTPTTVGAVLYVGVFSAGVAYPMMLWLIETAGPVRTTLMTYIVPVVAGVAGWFVLGEQFGATLIGGFAIIVVGFALLEREALLAEFPWLKRVLPAHWRSGAVTSRNADDD
jgi:drug/metabolite transporter (DMT)-like permease